MLPIIWSLWWPLWLLCKHYYSYLIYTSDFNCNYLAVTYYIPFWDSKHKYSHKFTALTTTEFHVHVACCYCPCTISTVNVLPWFYVLIDQIFLLRELASLFKKEKPGVLLQSYVIGTYVTPCTIEKPVWHVRIAVGHKVPTRMKLLKVSCVDVTRIEQMMLGSVYAVKRNFQFLFPQGACSTHTVIFRQHVRHLGLTRRAFGFKFHRPSCNKMVEWGYPRGDDVEFAGILHMCIGIVTFSPRCGVEHLKMIITTQSKADIPRRSVICWAGRRWSKNDARSG